MDERVYWLGFSSFPGIGPKKFSQLLTSFSSAKNAWEADQEQLLKVIGEALSQKFIHFRKTFSLSQYSERLEQSNVWYITLSDPDYPQRLRGSSNPPFILYGKGKKEVLQEENTIGIVGTRKITGYGRQVTAMITQELTSAGYVVVSGLAMGVDAVAHATTLAAHGKTIAVLGCGVDCCNPRSNQQLYEKITQGDGCVISEFPLSAEPTVGSFPSRNRIIAGLSRGIIVTEGAADSGALITAADAFKDNRPVFAVPGPITSSLSKGPHSLLAKGAVLITNGQDVLTHFGEKKRSTQKWIIPEGSSTEETELLKLLALEALSFDQLMIKANFDVAQLNKILSLMELKQLITLTQEGTYQLVLTT